MNTGIVPALPRALPRAFFGLLLEDGGFIPVAIQADLLHLDGTSTQSVPER